MENYYNPEVEQQYNDTCAIKCQELILKDFGIDVTETDLVNVAHNNGWYDGGTAPCDVGKLLECASIPVTRQENANVFNLVSELAQGHKVIVGVDSQELWHNSTMGEQFSNWVNDIIGNQGGDHALIVMGIDTSDINNIQVIVKDPGTGEEGKPYPLDQFMDAWADTNCFMASTQVPAPLFADGMQNFDNELGHIPTVAGVNYPDFQLFNDLSMGLPVHSTDNQGQMFSPMSSLTDAFFDYSSQQIGFNDIFSDDYAFNEYLDYNLVNDYMRPTCMTGLNDIDWNNIQLDTFSPNGNFNYFELANMGADFDYYNFYNDCMNQFNLMGDMNSMQLCQQQLDILDYCSSNDIDYSSNFLDF